MRFTGPFAQVDEAASVAAKGAPEAGFIPVYVVATGGTFDSFAGHAISLKRAATEAEFHFVCCLCRSCRLPGFHEAGGEAVFTGADFHEVG